VIVCRQNYHSFPNLFEPSPLGTPILDKVKTQLAKGNLPQADIEMVTCVQYIHEPIDIVKVCCFGQTTSVHEMVITQSMSNIEKIFLKYKTERGLPTSVEHYIVRATV
jgi:hypothetical protein